MRVSDVMTRHPITIDSDAAMSTAIAVMTERGIRHLPVVDADRRLIGMLSDRDVQSVAFAPVIREYLSTGTSAGLREVDEAIQGLRVKDVMTWDAVTIGADAPLAQAAAMMFEGRFGSVVVVADGVVIGIVTRHDALRALAAELPCVRGSDPDTYLL